MYLGVKAIRPVKPQIISGKIVNGCIYAVNHTNGNDFPTAAQIVKHHFYILADYTMKKDIGVNILNRLNGVVYVDRKSRQNRAKAKDDLIYLLNNNKNVLLFPEGTWNLSPNLLTLPLNWGIIDISNASGKPIQPIIISYTDGKTYCKIGDPFYSKQDANKKENIDKLREIMTTMMWELIEQDGLCHRSKINIDYYNRWVKQQLDTYKKLDFEYEQSVIRKEFETSDDVFSHLKNIEPKANNSYLFNKGNHD